jgi:hypothetical protein
MLWMRGNVRIWKPLSLLSLLSRTLSERYLHRWVRLPALAIGGAAWSSRRKHAMLLLRTASTPSLRYCHFGFALRGNGFTSAGCASEHPTSTTGIDSIFPIWWRSSYSPSSSI